MKTSRKWAYLKNPYKTNAKDIKIMLHTVKDGAYVYLYTSPEAENCSFDLWYDSVNAALSEWSSEISGGWHNLPDSPSDGYDNSYIG